MNVPSTPPRVMRGSSAGAAGAAGYAPGSAAGDQAKFLRADGSWQLVPGGGDMLAANQLGEFNDAAKKLGARTNLDVYSKDEARALATGRQFSPWVESFGTSGCSQFQGPFTAGSRGWLAGAALAQWVGFVTVPAVVSTVPVICGLHPTTTDGNNRITIAFDTGGALLVGAVAVQYGNIRQFKTAVGFNLLHAGKRVWMEFLLTQGTTNPIVRFDGVDISAQFTASTTGTPPAGWLDATLVPTYHATGYNWPAGEAPLGCWLNGHLTQSESIAWMITGKPPAWVQAGGSQRSILSNGSAFDSVWIQSWVTVAANTTTAPDSTNTADTITETATTQQHYVSQAVQFNAGLYEFSFYAKTNGRSVYFEMGSLRAAYDFSTAVFTAVNSYAATWSAISGSATDVGSGWVLFRMRGMCLVPGSYICKMHTTPNGNAYLGLLYAGDGTSGIFLADARVLPIGALSLPKPQANGTIDDWTAIGGNPGRCAAMRCVTDDPFWRLVVSVDSSGTGNKQLLSGAVFAEPDKQALDFVDVETDGSVTFSLGDGTTATRYTASTAVTAGRTRVALSSPFPADAAKTGLYANVTVAGGTYLRFVISGHRTL